MADDGDRRDDTVRPAGRSHVGSRLCLGRICGSAYFSGVHHDTISSDVHTLCIDGPAFDLVTALSKFLCIGMPLDRVIAAATVNAATCIKRPNFETIRIGSVGNASILSIHHGRFYYVDAVGELHRAAKGPSLDS